MASSALSPKLRTSTALSTSAPAPVHDPLTKSAINVLIVDDDRALRETCVGLLSVDGYAVASGTPDEALEWVKRRAFDFILLDLSVASVSPMEILAATLRFNRRTLVAVMTSNPSVESCLKALRAGAWDYLLKPFTPTHLEVLIGRATHAIFSSRAAGQRALRAAREHGNSDLVTCLGVSTFFRHAVDLARRVAMSDASVMLYGESGTGKEVIAQLIHRHSIRGERKLVALNCAALPETLLESEMFGHRKGSFTGADRDKAGLLEVANGGTLFLDEITEMSPRLQAKLLRVLQDGVVRRVGSERDDTTVDVRVISASNREPHQAVQQGCLRKDLFYRLRVVLIKLPPLRHRVEDIPILAQHFLAHYWHRYRRPHDSMPRFGDAALELLKARPWQGNVRELQNVMEHLAALVEPGHTIRPDDIPFYDDPSTTSSDVPIPLPLLEHGYYSARDKLVAEFERAYLSRLVGRAGGNMSKAARIASIDRTTLYRLIERHHINTRDVATSESRSVGEAAD
jgi:DNA-binding NtrC family response regulator